ncbi:hypothetical protein XU18_2940 [Perkinsela sp. CCAP 1560/4]|nr:hypothetical protein XU18_2940 [Perkinsela sp. CCAP 1560/4]|eukprot:KNH06184.1 hypothetical protein XU18_2940 [Perkinsela sp. CCAP 1560/4]
MQSLISEHITRYCAEKKYRSERFHNTVQRSHPSSHWPVDSRPAAYLTSPIRVTREAKDFRKIPKSVDTRRLFYGRKCSLRPSTSSSLPHIGVRQVPLCHPENHFSLPVQNVQTIGRNSEHSNIQEWLNDIDSASNLPAQALPYTKESIPDRCYFTSGDPVFADTFHCPLKENSPMGEEMRYPYFLHETEEGKHNAFSNGQLARAEAMELFASPKAHRGRIHSQSSGAFDVDLFAELDSEQCAPLKTHSNRETELSNFGRGGSQPMFFQSSHSQVDDCWW